MNTGVTTGSSEAQSGLAVGAAKSYNWSRSLERERLRGCSDWPVATSGGTGRPRIGS